MAPEERIELSVVTVSPDGLDALEDTLAALRAQSGVDRMELVVVAPREVPADPKSLAGFGATRRVAVGEIETLAPAIAAGMRAASGPVVAYAEEHSLPEPGWAEALISRHRGPWAAVAWSLENANSKTLTSWAHLLVDFGPAVAPVESGECMGPLPWHHVSYKREELLARDDRLEELLETESLLHDELRAEGRRIYLEGRAASRHLNVSRLRPHLASHYFEGRASAATRARTQRWSPARRLAHAVGSPLIPLVRLRRLIPDVRRVRARSGRRWALIPRLGLGLAVTALGEAVGYLFGPGRSRRRLLAVELDRRDHLSD